MKTTIELTAKGQERINILYAFLESKGIKDLFLKRVNESRDDYRNADNLAALANIEKYFSVKGLLSEGFDFDEVPELVEYWEDIEEQYRQFCETLNF